MRLGVVGVSLSGSVLNSYEAKRRALQDVSGRVIGAEYFAGKHVVEEKRTFPSSEPNVKPAPISVAEYAEAMRRLYETDKFFEWAEPLPGVVSVLRELSASGCEIRFISSVLGLNEGRIWAWISQHELTVSNVVATRKKPKTPHFQNCDVVVDNEAEQLAQVKKRILRILLMPGRGTTGYRQVQLPKPLPRGVRVAQGWGEAARYLGISATLQ